MIEADIAERVERYMRLPYRHELIPDEGGWFVQLPDLPGCMSQGDTIEDAIAMIRDEQCGWLEVSLEHGDPIPEPSSDDHRYTGKFKVRVPKDLHRALVATASEQGVILNLLVATTLSASMYRVTNQDFRRPEVTGMRHDVLVHRSELAGLEEEIGGFDGK